MVLDAVTTLFRVVICFAAAATASGISGDSGYVLRWASAGGGWRSMISNIGYANSFAQSGIIDPNRGTCNFTAISSNSGGSWFTMQFFYSQPFFDNVVSTDKTAVYVFIIDWLQSYGNFLEDLPRTLPCLAVSPFGLIPDLEEASSFCDIVMSYDGSWGGFIEGMLRKVAEGYGDPELPDRLANANNRVSALRDTDCFVQTSLAADSRYARSKGGILLRSSDDVNYVSPSDSDRVLAVSLGAQYAVKGNRTFFQYALPDSDLPLMTHWARGPRKFRYDDWDDFHLYPSTDNRDIFASKLPSTSGSGLLADPFKGNPNVAQIAAASSAALSLLSPAVPSFFAQYSSLRQYDKNAGLTSKDFNLTAINALFNIQLTRDLAVCTQWPSKCGSADGRFLDGGFTDGPTLAANVGQYHTVDNGDLNKTMKVILTNTKFHTDSNVKFLSYFSTYFNQGVAPGEFIWPPSTEANHSSAQKAPWRSMQIFTDYLDDESMLSQLQRIPETRGLTTAVFQATTINNVAFGVKAGQKVEILLLQINSDIPTLLFSKRSLDRYVVSLADLAQEIMGSKELVSRIKNFLAM